ncbi:MAG: universal stress protein [Ginsengibacter sp.]
MKKFLAIFDGYKMSKASMLYAIELAQSANAHLVGVFLDEFLYRSYNFYRTVTKYKNYEDVMKDLNNKDKKKRDEAVLLFQKTCEKSKIKFSIHRNKNIAMQELKHESMFADLMIINEYETFAYIKETPPTRFIRELLSDVGCPVIVTPAAYKTIDKIVLLYDGKPYALHSIKAFSYLFDNLQNLPVEVFTVKDDKMKGMHLPDNKLMREFIKRHFPQANFTVKKGSAEFETVKHLRSLSLNTLVVLGAYQRSDLSRWFKTSMADILMKEIEKPLFMAHTK